MNKLKILHIASLSRNPNAGPTYSIPALIKSQNTDISTSSLLNTFNKNEHSYRDEFIEFNLKDLSFKKLCGIIDKYDIFVFHSNYIPNYLFLSLIIRKKDKPYIIVPRGGFTKESKNIKKIKKKMADILLFNRYFNLATAYHYLTIYEQESSVYATENDFVLPNGINIKEVSNKRINNKRIVYIGRMDIYHKGIDVLLASVSRGREQLIKRGVEIHLYGPATTDTKKYILDYIDSNRIGDLIHLHNPVNGEEKQKIIKNSLAFIQTSRFEGLPMGILEALSLGTPCIVTPGTNLGVEVKNARAGIKVDLTESSILEGIIQFVDDSERHEEYCLNSIQLASQYDWEIIGKKSVSIYIEILKNYNLQVDN